MILEFAPAGSCFSLLQRQPQGRFPERQAAFFLRQVARAVSYCHERHVIHRDIKPENILLSGEAPNFTVKLADFGWVRSLYSCCRALRWQAGRNELQKLAGGARAAGEGGGVHTSSAQADCLGC
jgi:serine/threonine protein kinase